MAGHATEDESRVRNDIQRALEKAGDANKPITDLPDFLILVKDYYLAPLVYKQYERIITEMWFDKQNTRPPSPAASTATDFINTNVIPGDLASLEAEDKTGVAWVVLPTVAECKPTKYEHRNCNGSFVRADSIEYKGLTAGKDVYLDIPWYTNDSRNGAAEHSACRVIDEDMAKDMGIGTDVGLLFGQDFKEQLKHQAFGDKVESGASRRPHDVVEKEKEKEEEERPQTTTLPALPPSPEQHPRVARFEAPLQIHLHAHIYSTQQGADFATIFGGVFQGMGFRSAATQHDANG